jgi:hypothetical protein
MGNLLSYSVFFLTSKLVSCAEVRAPCDWDGNLFVCFWMLKFDSLVVKVHFLVQDEDADNNINK